MAGIKAVGTLAFLVLTVLHLAELTVTQSGVTPSKLSASESGPSVSGSETFRARTSDESLPQELSSTRLFRTDDEAWRIESSKSVHEAESGDERQRYTNLVDPVNEDATLTAVDPLTSSKLVDHIDSNQIEVKPGEYYRNMESTTSESMPPGEARGAPEDERQEVAPWSEPRAQAEAHPHFLQNQQSLELDPQNQRQRQWELQHLPRQARQDDQLHLDKSSNARPAPPPPPTPRQGQSSQKRQAGSEIQSIIQGLFNFLQVNSQKPHRNSPQPTRINNRGPPDYVSITMLPPVHRPVVDQPSTYEKPPAPSPPAIHQMPPDLPFLNFNPPNRQKPQRPASTRQPVLSYQPQTSMNLHPNSMTETNHQQQLFSGTNRVEQSNESKIHQSVKGTAGNQQQQQQIAASPTRKIPSTLRTDNPTSDNTLVLGAIPIQPQQIITVDDEPKPVVPLKSSQAASSAASSASASTNDSPNDKNKSTKVQSTQMDSETPVISSQATMTTEISSKIEPTSSMETIMQTSSILSVGSPLPTPSTSIRPLESSTLVLLPSSDVTLEPSIAPTTTTELSSSVSTPTEGLSSSFIRPSGMSHRVPGTTSSITFTKGQSAYRPRPGIVLDDTLDYAGAQGIVTHAYRPFRRPAQPETFDVVVSAIHGPGGSGTGEVKVPVNGIHGSADDILTAPVEGQGFVSIDGKRTYLNLFDSTDSSATKKNHEPVQPTRTHQVLGTSHVVPHPTTGLSPRPSPPMRHRPTYPRRPNQPTVRIDTCIVGDSSTCDASQHETCATVNGVSACHCKPGFARLTHSLPCKKIVSIVVSIRVDKMYDRKIVWDKDLADADSELYFTLAYEANRAIESAMSMTPFSDEYVLSLINNIYEGDVSQGQGGVFVNATLKLAYEPRTARQSLAGELQKHLLGVIQRRYNNIGNSALYVDSPAGSISTVQDLDECASPHLNDCHQMATCTNTWGGFTCSCNTGLKDPRKGDPLAAGRTCLSCPSSHCNNRGTCSYQNDQMQCSCIGNYYGSQCEIDGEVLGVAIGASVIALIIIVLTLVCLISWSRKWSREQKAMSPVYGYVQGGLPGTLPGSMYTGSMGTLASAKQGPPSTLSPYIWAQLPDHLASANIYATEPMGPTRPSSTMFAYPTLSMHGTLPPVPLPRLQAPPRARQRHQPPPEPDSSDSEPQDKDRADLIPHSNFQVPRPKSRSSLANQSGIYHDVEYDQGDARHLSKNNIPMSTYSMAPYYRT